MIVSPFVKLDSYFKEIFERHKHNHKLEITIIFGKNESQPNKSLRQEDFEFFKQFKNIAVIYCKDLHAKYYGNEKHGVITSINLYDKSFETNVEYGVAYQVDFMSAFQTTADKAAWQHSFELAEKSPLVFLKRPVYESGLLSAITGKKYIDTEVLYDATAEISNGYQWTTSKKRYLSEFPESLNIGERTKERPVKAEFEDKTNSPKLTTKDKQHHTSNTRYSSNALTGYCIRTGVKIPFDINKPMSYEAYRTWAEFENYDYPENFCHKTGRSSNGKTSMRNPIL